MGKFKTNEEYFAFSKRLVVIPTEDIRKLLEKFKISLPLFIHAFLLRETIRSKVFEEKLYDTYTDELKYRLRGYDRYSVYPLEKMIEKFNLDFEVARYKELLFDIIFLNLDRLSLKNSFLNELEQLQHNYTVDLEVMSYHHFYSLFKSVYHETPGYLDGVPLDHWDDEMLNSYTLGDLKELGQKYGVDIPRRINKAKLIEILTAKFNLTGNEASLLVKMSVLDLEIYAKEKGFRISIDLKKQDMIEYIQYAREMYHKPIEKDDFSYDVPLESHEDEVVSDIEEEPIRKPAPKEVVIPVEEDIEVPEIVEEKPIEVMPEETEETTKTEIVEETIIPEQKKEPEIKPETKPITKAAPKPEIKEEPELQAPVEVTPESLLSSEEKELLDEKINQIIKRFYKKRRRRRIIWTVTIVLIMAILGFVGYSYYYYTINGILPFGLSELFN